MASDFLLNASQLMGQSLNDPDTIIATTNVGHLARFFPADVWSNVAP